MVVRIAARGMIATAIALSLMFICWLAAIALHQQVSEENSLSKPLPILALKPAKNTNRELLIENGNF